MRKDCRLGNLSYGGKSILINTSLTRILMYKWVFIGSMKEITKSKKIDSLRGKFIWEGVGNKKKYHMIKWEALAVPRESGGLGFIETRAMNTALLSKWIFRLESKDDSMCMKLLRKKIPEREKLFLVQNTEGPHNFGRAYIV